MGTRKYKNFNVMILSIILILCILFFFVIAFENTRHPISDEHEITKTDLISEYTRDGRTIRESIIQLRQQTGRSNYRGWVYHWAYSIDTKADVADGYLVFKCSLCIPTLQNLFNDIPPANSGEFTKYFDFYSYDQRLGSRLFTGDVVKTLLELNQKGVFRPAIHLNEIIVKDSKIEIRYFILQSIEQLESDSLLDNRISDADIEETVNLLLSMTSNLEVEVK
jgi:hypothetical protein